MNDASQSLPTFEFWHIVPARASALLVVVGRKGDVEGKEGGTQGEGGWPVSRRASCNLHHVGAEMPVEDCSAGDRRRTLPPT